MMASENVLHLTDAQFDRTIGDSKLPVLVDFWAEWCGPCRRIGPIVEELAEEFKDKLTVAKIDIETEQETANKLDVHSIPTLLIFKNGQVAERIVGAVPKETLVEAINRVL
jgi:thioredoxin 1